MPAPTTKRIQHLSDADQSLSDRAVDACNHASPERRTIAWREANQLGSTLLEKVCIFSAYCLRATVRTAPTPTEVLELAKELEGIHHRHEAAVAAYRADALA
jgi:hypothetical protein